jgi:hypothetical protein
MISTSLKRQSSIGCCWLSGRRLDGLYLCPRPKKKPTPVLTGSGWNQSIHVPCLKYLSCFRPMWEVKMQPPPSHSMVASKHDAVEAMSLAGLPNRNTRIANKATCFLCRWKNGWAGWSRDCRSHISEAGRTNGRNPKSPFINKYPCTEPRPVSRPTYLHYPTWEVAFDLPGSWVSPAQVSYFIVSGSYLLRSM